MTENVFAGRRRQLMERIGPQAIAIIGGRSTSRRNHDVEYRFRQTSDLLYLTGFEEPESLALIAPGREKPFVLFVRPRDKERETWTGRRSGLEGARQRFGADEAFAISELSARLPSLLDGADEILFIPGDEPTLDQVLLGALASLRNKERQQAQTPSTIRDLRHVLHEMRLIKDADGLAHLRRAAEITTEAHVEAMKAGQLESYEYQLEALVDYVFRRHGGQAGYGTIVGSGANATILHYVDARDPLRPGRLVLIDAGCEIAGFTVDVTRTWPRGRFSPAQKRIYELVLDTEKICIERVRPGATLDQIHSLAVERLTRGLVDIGLLSGSVESLIETGAYRRFYMHRTSHWLGMDVHDAGLYYPNGRARALATNMVLTVEPGIYIPEDALDVAEEYRGVGVRIEDDVLVTAGGHEVLTRAIPKEVDEIEAVIRSAGRTQ